jgi:hypothetical protein
MLYVSVLLALLTLSQAQYEPIMLKRSIHWRDFVNCDDTSWYFDSVEPDTTSRHRDGTEDMTEGVCYRGEWSSDGTDGNVDVRNLWGGAQFAAFEDNEVTPINNFYVRIMGRMYGYCDWESSDDLYLEIRTQWTDDGDCPICGYDDNYDTDPVTLFTIQKNRNNCDGWSGQMTNANTDWLDEVECTTGNNGVSCYWDYDVVAEVTNGNRFELKWHADMNDGWDNEAWAFGDLHIDIVDIGPPCCTGTRNDKPHKSCGAFHEQRNCEAKGCDWNVEDSSQCTLSCCRFADKTKVNKEKPQCRDLNEPPNFIDMDECNSRDECTVTECDVIGMSNNGDGIPGNGE